MNTEITDNKGKNTIGCIFYDGDCAFCTGLARRFHRILAKRGFALATLQSKVGVPPAQSDEMRLRISDGRELGGADAVIEIARRIWWAWPLWLVRKIPGAMPILRSAYRFIAASRHCVTGACDTHLKGNPK